jgi:hypothetical protein
MLYISWKDLSTRNELTRYRMGTNLSLLYTCTYLSKSLTSLWYSDFWILKTQWRGYLIPLLITYRVLTVHLFLLRRRTYSYVSTCSNLVKFYVILVFKIQKSEYQPLKKTEKQWLLLSVEKSMEWFIKNCTCTSHRQINKVNAVISMYN